MCSAAAVILICCAIDNNTRYGPNATNNQHGQMHRRSGSVSHHLDGLPPPELPGLIRPVGTPNIVDADVFPPSRSQAPDPSIFLPYMAEDISFEDEYEEYMKGLGWSDEQSTEGPLFGGPSAWQRFPKEFAIPDDISDSETVVSIGDLGEESGPSKDDHDLVDENLNNWEVCTQEHDRRVRTKNWSIIIAHESEDYGSSSQVPCYQTVELWYRITACASVWA